MSSRRFALPVLTVAAVLALAGRAHAASITGTVSLQGQVVLAAPIPGIAVTDLEVSVKEATEATGNGETCEISATTSDGPDGGGNYPSGGTVSLTITISRGGGPQIPDGECIVTVVASGNDGVSVSAKGSQTIFLTAADIDADATVNVPTMTVRESKAVAGVDSDCLKWTKKQLKLRSRCNFLLLKGGPAFATRCRDAGPEPAGCDPGNFVESILALSHGPNDQQTDAMNAEGVDFDLLRDQVVCQNKFGRAAFVFASRRAKLVQNLCIATALDSVDCRGDRSRDAKPKLDIIDRCGASQMVDGGTGRAVPDVGAPCDTCIGGGGQIDRKCLKSCFQTALDELTDGILGDIPECGDGIVQPNGGEFCDDGNTTGGDGCSATCTVEGP
jgi:cysteine-rich repeat protein